MEDKNSLFSKEEEDELIPLLKEGKVILFLGAGFSINTVTIKGQSIPSAAVLAQRMNLILTSYGEKGYSENNVSDLKMVSESFYNLYKSSTESIDNFFRSNLSVDRTKINPYYHYLKNVRWNGIYTTNYDDLLDAIYESELKNGIATKCVFRQKSDLPNDENFNIIYLNGDLNSNARFEKINNAVITDLICSTTDFATGKVPEIWNCFIEKFRQYPILIIGSQLNEEFFYSKLGELINQTNINTSTRPKSYIINIDDDDQKFTEIGRAYNLHHKVAKTDQFLNWLGEISSRLEFKSDSPSTNKIKEQAKGFIEITTQYWKNLEGKKSTEELIKYYTNINSSPLFLPYVIANKLYVEPNEELSVKSFSPTDVSVKTKLNTLLPKQSGNYNSLLKIHANGGTGKTTLLFHIGKKYCERYHVLFFKDLIFDTALFPLYPDDTKPVIILLDNYGRSLNELVPFSQALKDLYFTRGFCFIIAERFLQKSKLDAITITELEENFSDVKDCRINNDQAFYQTLFNKIADITRINKDLNYEQTSVLEINFISPTKATTAERIIELLISIKYAVVGFQFKFDWEDWEDLCLHIPKLKPYTNLYAIVAAFNAYNVTPPIKFCIGLLGIDDPKLIDTYKIFSDANFDFPLYILNDKCFELRNPNLGKWYIVQKDSAKSLTKKVFAEAFKGMNCSEHLYILRNSYRNYELLNDAVLKPLIPKTETALKYFHNFINSNPLDEDNSKNKMEIAVISLLNNNSLEAEKYCITLLKMTKTTSMQERS